MSTVRTYYAFSSKQADDNWQFAVEDLSYLRSNGWDRFNEDLELNDRQENFRGIVDNIVEAKELSEESMVSTLMDIDVAYGLVAKSDDFEDLPDDIFLQILTERFGLKKEGEFISGEGLVEIFPIKKEDIKEMTVKLQEMHDWDEEEAEEGMRMYIESIKPIARAMRDFDNIALVLNTGTGEFGPGSMKELLMERARKHYADMGEELYEALGIKKLLK